MIYDAEIEGMAAWASTFRSGVRQNLALGRQACRKCSRS